MTKVFFNNSGYQTEGVYYHSDNVKPPLALLLNSYSLYSEGINNDVIYALYKVFLKDGFSVLCINFKDIENNNIAELTDATGGLDWLQSKNRLSSGIWVVSFSSSSWAGMQIVMRRPEVTHFLVVSPQVSKYDFSFLAPCPVSGFVIQGDQDSVTQEATVMNFVNRISQHKHITISYKFIKGADHFFRNKTDELSTTVDEYIRNQLSIESNSTNESEDAILVD